MDEFLDSHVKIYSTDGIYAGVLKSYDLQSERIALIDVTCPPDNTKIPGISNFYRKDIRKIEIIKRKKKSLKSSVITNLKSKPSKTKAILKQKESQPHLDRLKDIDFDQLTLNKCKKDAVSATESSDERQTKFSRLEKFSTDLDQRLTADQSSTTYIFIDTLDNNFYDSIDYISAESLVGVGFEGVNIGKDGQLCWVNIATRSVCLLFDIVSLGEGAMSHGLANIFQKESIQKIIHDCRQISSLLYHQYQIKLINVFDTQVGDVMATRTQKNQTTFSKHVSSLSQVLRRRFPDLDSNDVYIHRVRELHFEEDQRVFAKRPPPPELIEACIKNITYLFSLRHVLMNKMLLTFTKGVNLYLSDVRDAPDDSIKHNQLHSHKLPWQFCEFINRPRNPTDKLDKHGFLDVSYDMQDPEIIFSKDSVFHKRDSPKKDSSAGLSKSINKTNSFSDGFHGYSSDNSVSLFPSPPKISTTDKPCPPSFNNQAVQFITADSIRSSSQQNLKSVPLENIHRLSAARARREAEQPTYSSSDDFDAIPSSAHKTIFSANDENSSAVSNNSQDIRKNTPSHDSAGSTVAADVKTSNKSLLSNTATKNTEQSHKIYLGDNNYMTIPRGVGRGLPMVMQRSLSPPKPVAGSGPETGRLPIGRSSLLQFYGK